MPNEPQWILEEQGKYGNINAPTEKQGLPNEANEYEDLQISEYEQQNGVPYLVDKLQIKTDYMFDPDVMLKVRAVEEFIFKEIRSGELRDSKVGYETILERMMTRLPDPLERMIQQKENQKALQFLFLQASMDAKLSGESYLKKVKSSMKEKRVGFLLSQIKTGLNQIVANK